MRTTLTIDDAIDRKLRQIAKETGQSFKQVINDTLKAGLAARPARRRYRLKPSSLGEPSPEYNLTKSLALADQLEDDELHRKLMQRK